MILLKSRHVNKAFIAWLQVYTIKELDKLLTNYPNDIRSTVKLAFATAKVDTKADKIYVHVNDAIKNKQGVYLEQAIKAFVFGNREEKGHPELLSLLRRIELDQDLLYKEWQYGN